MRAQAAALPGLGDAPRKPKGGYRLIPVVQLCMAWSAYRAGLIRLFDLRVYFACHEMVARRCLSAKTSLPSCFTLKELDRLTGLGAKRLKASLGRLTAARLLIWSEAAIAFPGSAESLPEEGRKVLIEMLDQIPNHERLVPVPRRTLRLLAGGGAPGPHRHHPRAPLPLPLPEEGLLPGPRTVQGLLDRPGLWRRRTAGQRGEEGAHPARLAGHAQGGAGGPEPLGGACRDQPCLGPARWDHLCGNSSNQTAARPVTTPTRGAIDRAGGRAEIGTP